MESYQRGKVALTDVKLLRASRTGRRLDFTEHIRCLPPLLHAARDEIHCLCKSRAGGRSRVTTQHKSSYVDTTAHLCPQQSANRHCGSVRQQQRQRRRGVTYSAHRQMSVLLVVWLADATASWTPTSQTGNPLPPIGVQGQGGKVI